MLNSEELSSEQNSGMQGWSSDGRFVLRVFGPKVIQASKNKYKTHRTSPISKQKQFDTYVRIVNSLILDFPVHLVRLAILGLFVLFVSYLSSERWSHPNQNSNKEDLR